jgi:hypothetical protein
MVKIYGTHLQRQIDPQKRNSRVIEKIPYTLRQRKIKPKGGRTQQAEERRRINPRVTEE